MKWPKSTLQEVIIDKKEIKQVKLSSNDAGETPSPSPKRQATIEASSFTFPLLLWLAGNLPMHLLTAGGHYKTKMLRFLLVFLQRYHHPSSILCLCLLEWEQSEAGAQKLMETAFISESGRPL